MATNSHPPPSSWAQRTLVFLLLLILGAGFYGYLERDVIRRWFAQDLIGREMELLSEKVDHLEEELAAAKAEIELLSPTTPSEKVLEVFGTDSRQTPDMEASEGTCAHLARGVGNLFTYLDSRSYLQERTGTAGSKALFREILARAIQNPPIVAKETDNILRVLQNSAHFFRSLGKNDTLLLATWMRNEADLMEQTLALSYELVGLDDRCLAEGVDLNIALPDAYQYAAYFLNTLGGRSYLLRRDSRVRMLTQYYAILVLDRANDQQLNQWGLDIRAPIETLLADMKSAANLVRKKDYLSTLIELKAKYDELYRG